MRASRVSLAALIAVSFALPLPAHATGGDGWPALAHDAQRTARSLGQGAMSAAPSIAWQRPMGGSLADTQVTVSDLDGDGVKEIVLVSAGRVVAKRHDDTLVWASPNIGATRVLGVSNLDGQGAPEVIAVGTSPVGLYVLSGQSGAILLSVPTPTTAIDAVTTPNPAGGERLFLTQQLGPMMAFAFPNGIMGQAQNQIFTTGSSPWSIDLAAADVDGDGALEIVRGHDRGFVAYDAATGAVRCDSSNLINNTIAPSYFPAFSAKDVTGDGRAEVILYDYSYYYSEDAGVFVVSCNGNGAVLSPVTLWKQQWLNDVTPGPGNDVNARQIRYLADAVADLDGQSPPEMVYSLWDTPTSTWTTYVVNAATGAVITSRVGEVLEGVLDLDNDGQAEVLLREATGIGVLPKPFFSKLRGYDLTAGSLVDKGWIVPEARVAGIGAYRAGALVTPGAGSVAGRQNVNGAADAALEAYVFQKAQGGGVADFRPGKLLAVHGTDGVILRKYDFPQHITGSVHMLAGGVTQAGAVSEALVMLTDGGLRVLDDQFAEAGKVLPGNYARLVTVGSLDGLKNLIFAVDSSDGLLALDGSVLQDGLPKVVFRAEDAAQSESRGYVNAPGLVLPLPAGGAALVARGHSDASYEEQALVAFKADGTVLWKTDVGPGRQVPSFENMELVSDVDNDGFPDIFLTELTPASEQELVVRSGVDGFSLVSRPVGALFPPSGVYLQGHAAADITGDGVPDIVSALHGSWFVGIDISQAGMGDPLTGFTQIFRTSNGPNGQAMVGELDGDAALDLVRVASQNAFGSIERRSLAGVVEASYSPPTQFVAGSDANTAALLARPGAPGMFDVVWSGMAGSAIGGVARIHGQSMTEVWFDYLSGGMVYPKASPPAVRAALFSPIALDVDGDGADEVLVGSDDGYLYALHGSDGSLLFAVNLGAPVVHVVAADVDKDAAIELLAVLGDGTLVALDVPGGYDATIVTTPEGGMGGMGGMGASSSGSGGGGGMMSGSSSSTSTSSSSSTGSSGVGPGGGGNAGGGGTGGGNNGEQGGCGCKAAGEGESAVGFAAWLLAGAVVVMRRRRRA